jgi:hypothetical protein
MFSRLLGFGLMGVPMDNLNGDITRSVMLGFLVTVVCFQLVILVQLRTLSQAQWRMLVEIRDTRQKGG